MLFSDQLMYSTLAGKWNEESTDYYSNIIEESTHLTPAQEEAEIVVFIAAAVDRKVMAANW